MSTPSRSSSSSSTSSDTFGDDYIDFLGTLPEDKVKHVLSIISDHVTDYNAFKEAKAKAKLAKKAEVFASHFEQPEIADAVRRLIIGDYVKGDIAFVSFGLGIKKDEVSNKDGDEASDDSEESDEDEESAENTEDEESK